MIRVVVIIQARMGSTRLPGKVLKPLMGKPMLAFMLERLTRMRAPREIVVATSGESEDDPIAKLCEDLSVLCFRGSREDVLARYREAARWRKAEWVVRLTGDCPLIDPAVVDAVIAEALRDNPDGPCDYVSNTLNRTFPRGLDVEAFSARALEIAWTEAKDPAEREHVTPFLYRRPERFRLGSVRQAENTAHHRWTVDTPEDFSLVERIVNALYPVRPDFNQGDILDLLQSHPDWEKINAHIQQAQAYTRSGI